MDFDRRSFLSNTLAVDAPVPFADGGLAAFEGRTAVLTFEMSDADLYSFRFRR